MPRKPRSAIGDIGIFHVYCRGNNKKKVFHDDEDHRRFKLLVAKAKVRHKIRIYDYCLMPNHYHFQMESITEKNLSKALQWINQRYSVWHKNKYGGLGHLWQGRFKNKFIRNETHFLTCRLYIEANAVKAGICDHPKDYKWSSYLAHAHGKRDLLLDYDSFYILSGISDKDRQSAHRAKMKEYLAGKFYINSDDFNF